MRRSSVWRQGLLLIGDLDTVGHNRHNNWTQRNHRLPPATATAAAAVAKKTAATMVSAAFSRSRMLMARHDVSPHMTKWWKAVRPDDGQVSISLVLGFLLGGRGGDELIGESFTQRSL